MQIADRDPPIEFQQAVETESPRGKFHARPHGPFPRLRAFRFVGGFPCGTVRSHRADPQPQSQFARSAVGPDRQRHAKPIVFQLWRPLPDERIGLGSAQPCLRRRRLSEQRNRRWEDLRRPRQLRQQALPSALDAAPQDHRALFAPEFGRIDDLPFLVRPLQQSLQRGLLKRRNLELSEKHGLKRAACLLFSDRPEQYVSGAWIKIGFFVTDDDLRYQDEVHGSLFEQLEKTLELLHTKYLKAYISYQGLQRRETFLFPDLALREALLNAVVHKDYASGIPIQISVYDDKVVFWNPGVLPESWTLEKLLGKHPSRPFNPLLANAFFRAGYIEAWGRGIEKMNRECRDHEIEPPLYDFSMAGLMLTFRANPAHLQAVAQQSTQDGLGEKLGEKLGETRAAIVKSMRNDPKITTTKLAEKLGLSTTAVEKNIHYLKSHGHVKRIGPAKGGHWEVLK